MALRRREKTGTKAPDDAEMRDHGYQVVSLEPDSRTVRFFPWSHYAWLPLAATSWFLQARLMMVVWHTRRKSNATTALIILSTSVSILLARLVEDGWRFACIHERPRSRLRLIGSNVPAVDIVITTCGEDVDIILDTVRAACAQDYPAYKFRVLVSDDGQDEFLRAEIAELNESTDCDLLYFARPGDKGTKRGFKAGNMNAAIRYLDTLGPRRECVGFTDADMILSTDWLRACVAQLIAHRGAGIAVVPQRFYNLPVNDPLNQSLNTQGRRDDVQRDSMCAAWNTGPGAVFRREALDQAGGFPESVLIEDLLTGKLVNGAGWQVIYCREELQWGLVPDTLTGHTGQRMKWVAGTVRNAFFIAFGWSRRRLPRSSPHQRLIAIVHSLGPFVSTISRFLRTWIIITLGLATKSLILQISEEELRRVARLTLAVVVISHTEEIVVGLETGYLTLLRRRQGYVWLTPYLCLAVLREVVPDWMPGLQMVATPTAMLESAVRQRDPRHCMPLYPRLKVMIFRQGLWYHALCLTAFISLYWKAAQDVYEQQTSASLRNVCLILGCSLGTEWELMSAMVTPLWYAVSPPAMPPHRSFLYRESSPNDRFDVWRPKPTAMEEKFTRAMWLLELQPLLSIAFWIYASFGDHR